MARNQYARTTPKANSCPHCYRPVGQGGYKILFTIGLFSVCKCDFCGKTFLKAGV